MKKPDLNISPKVIVSSNETYKIIDKDPLFNFDKHFYSAWFDMFPEPKLIGAAAPINSIERMQSVENLIADKMMIVDTKNFHVSMLAELWNLYYDDGKIHLCQNIINYCKIKNAFDQLATKPIDILLISIKDSNDEVAPYATFYGGQNPTIKIIKNTEVIRDFEKRNLKRFMFMFLRIGLLIALIASLLIWLL